MHKTYLWSEVDNPVEFDNDAWISLLEAKTFIGQPRAATEQGPAEAASFPLPYVIIHTSTINVRLRNSCRWYRKDRLGLSSN